MRLSRHEAVVRSPSQIGGPVLHGSLDCIHVGRRLLKSKYPSKTLYSRSCYKILVTN